MKLVLLILILFTSSITGCSVTVNVIYSRNDNTVILDSVDKDEIEKLDNTHTSFFKTIKGGIVFIVDMLL